MYLFLSVTSHINCIAARCLIYMSFTGYVPLSGQDDVAHFNDVANDAESTHYIIIASLKSETIGKLINRIPGSCL